MDCGTSSASEKRAAPAPGRARQLILAMGVGTAVTLIFGLQPILLGALAHEGRLTDADLGRVATAEILALAVGAAIGPRMLSRSGMRALTVVSCIALALANVVIADCTTSWAIYADRTLAGLFEGGALSATIYILVHDRAADRVNGLFLAVSTIPQMIAAFVFPVYLLPWGGVDAGFDVLAVGALIAAALGGLFAGRVRNEAAAPTVKKIAWSPLILVGLGAIFIHGAGIGGAWSYVEALAAEHGLSNHVVGVSLAGSLGCQILGGAAVAWFGWRTPQSVALVVGSLLQAIIVLGLLYSRVATTFVPLAWLFGFFWLAMAPFQLQLMLKLDPTRSTALLLTPLSLVGFSAGPVVASLAVFPAHVGGAFILSSAMLAIAGTLYFVISTRRSGHGSLRRAHSELT